MPNSVGKYEFRIEGRHAWCWSTLSALGHFVEGIPFEEAETGARNGGKTRTEL
jgi:hypothetical protein